ncbi:MAG: putative metallo-hydrolase YycJ [Candidatus Ordinivivax streblomastigis]|uniref:Putative metallo-hydrolase YycJ n=1 Tax=Candidatus Ordinivivax streblomastigis TaxID=2540710 RepID=A0A5M8P510_9BACT|nr:MAG: putative metallo-hydrolase YycJ [Candidatus Ordinivivax streblomastigis]
MELQFLSLASGSSGNCYYLGTSEYGILLDAGIGFRAIQKILKDNGIDMERIMAVFITHDHADHIKSVSSLGEKSGIPVYATQAVHEGIEKSCYVHKKLSLSRRVIEKEQPVIVKDFKITAFDVPHDATDCVGYLVQYKDQKCVLATDVGYISETVGAYIRMANHLILEANYDREMLHNGNYPEFLKERIVSGSGHLCNTDAAEFLAANFDLHLKNIWLCHLSRENNHPDLACKTLEMEFGKYGIRIGVDVNVVALKRMHPSELYVLR